MGCPAALFAGRPMAAGGGDCSDRPEMILESGHVPGSLANVRFAGEFTLRLASAYAPVVAEVLRSAGSQDFRSAAGPGAPRAR